MALMKRTNDRKGRNMEQALKRITCPKCSKEFQPNFKVCPSCGTILEQHAKIPEMPAVIHSYQEKPQFVKQQAPSNWVTNPTAPWRRWAARSLDLALNGTVMIYAFAFTFFLIAPNEANQFFEIFVLPGGIILDILFTSIMGSILTGLIIGLTGSSLGKLIFGIKVTRLNGSLIGPIDGIVRDITVLVKGMGLGVPIIALFTQYFAYKKLKEIGSTSWDQGSYNVSYRKNSAQQYVLNFFGVVLIIVVVTVMRTLDMT